MTDNAYKIVEMAGSSSTSIEDAIKTAIHKADESVKHIRWFEVGEIRGHVENGEIGHYQVKLKLGFTLEGA